MSGQPEPEDVLTRHRFFADLDPALRTRMLHGARVVRFQPHSHLLREGEPATEFFAIDSGRVAVGIATHNRGLRVIETLHAGDVVGWSWLFAPYRWHFDALALEPVTALAIDAESLRGYLEHHPRAGFDVVRRIASVMEERLESTRLRLLDLYGDPRDSGR